MTAAPHVGTETPGATRWVKTGLLVGVEATDGVAVRLTVREGGRGYAVGDPIIIPAGAVDNAAPITGEVSIAANTVVFFMSDNGGTHADNLPLKGEKGMLTEGGIRVPLIARWPGTIPAGTVSHRKIHCIDYYSTCLQLAENRWRPPQDQHPLDGDSFAHVLRNPNTTEKRDPIFYLFPGYMDTRAQPTVVAIDDRGTKRYKIYYYYEADAWELYCLSDDPGEANNLIEEQPELASWLSKKIRDWLTQQHPTWKPKYPILKTSGEPAGPPPLF